MVRARLLAAAGVAGMGVLGGSVGLPPPVIAAGVLVIVAGLTSRPERRTAA